MSSMEDPSWRKPLRRPPPSPQSSTSSSSPMMKPPLKKSSTTFTCHVCGKTFRSQQGLAGHASAHIKGGVARRFNRRPPWSAYRTSDLNQPSADEPPPASKPRQSQASCNATPYYHDCPTRYSSLPNNAHADPFTDVEMDNTSRRLFDLNIHPAFSAAQHDLHALVGPGSFVHPLTYHALHGHNNIGDACSVCAPPKSERSVVNTDLSLRLGPAGHVLKGSNNFTAVQKKKTFALFEVKPSISGSVSCLQLFLSPPAALADQKNLVGESYCDDRKGKKVVDQAPDHGEGNRNSSPIGGSYGVHGDGRINRDGYKKASIQRCTMAGPCKLELDLNLHL